MDNQLITLHTFNYRHEAELAKSALEAAGIDAVVFSDDGRGQEVSLQFVRGAKLMVHEHDAMRAKLILKLD
jgi:ribonuclease BN (tRNA processing enzyme)